VPPVVVPPVADCNCSDLEKELDAMRYELDSLKLELRARWTHLSAKQEDFDLKQNELAFLVLQGSMLIDDLSKNMTDFQDNSMQATL